MLNAYYRKDILLYNGKEYFLSDTNILLDESAAVNCEKEFGDFDEFFTYINENYMDFLSNVSIYKEGNILGIKIPKRIEVGIWDGNKKIIKKKNFVPVVVKSQFIFDNDFCLKDLERYPTKLAFKYIWERLGDKDELERFITM